MNKQLMKDFINPGSQYRGAPFWAWNGKLDPDELRRQIRVMHRMGLGGFFMHSRVGLATEYLSEDWFECVNACIDEAEKLDMQAWLYDEDRWPSGAAGGLVTKNQKYRRRALGVEVLKPTAKLNWDADTVAAFSARIDNITVSEVKRIAKGKQPVKPAKDMAVLRFFIKIDDCSDWYNGQTYLDTLNDEAVREFIKVTHAVYAKRVGEHFGKRVPGIFTDEPNYGIAISTLTGTTKSVPWTGRLVSVFKERYGYDILKHLPELFFELAGKEISQVRYHYYDCITHLFVDAFSHQIGDWCDQNNMQHTGHVLLEETLSSQTNMVGSAMRFYEYMQAPGIDILTEKKREYDTARQCSSVARQFGRKWRLSETYGCTGWDFSFAGHKGTSNWQAALGINLRCQHLFWYTMEGEAKRDYPASIGYQSSWYDVYPKVEDYFARVNLVMTQGVEVRDLLVIHPIESMWTLFNMDMVTNPRIEEYDTMLIELRDSLLTASIDFDYGDEEMISRLAEITEAGYFQLGQAEYDTVLVPPMITIRSTTLDKLTEFAAAGGKVIFAGEKAAYVDAKPDTRAAAVNAISVPFEKAKITEVAKDAAVLTAEKADATPLETLLYQLREDENGHYLFIVNTDRKNGYDAVKLSIKLSGDVEEWNPDTGERFAVAAEKQADTCAIVTGFPASGSRIFVFPKKASELSAARPELTAVDAVELDLFSEPILMNEPNVLVLDRCAYQIENQAWEGPEEILRVDRAVRDFLGIDRRGGRQVQPWAWQVEANPKKCQVQLRYQFEVDEMPCGPLRFALEQPERFKIFLNGNEIHADEDHGWWVDRSLRTLPVDAAFLLPGENTLQLTCAFDREANLEAMYLLGQFGDELENDIYPVMVPLPDFLDLGDWVVQGLPFYSGAVTFQGWLECPKESNCRYYVEVPEFAGGCVQVRVNGKTAGVIGWQPYELDITDFLEKGENLLHLQLVSSRRNSHGPLHQALPEDVWTGSAQFVTEGERWTETYNLRPTGILAHPRLVVKKI
ncbi:hypothetical protein KAH55_01590 [bacterium]|nr:hypothetical protein [bacterium]